MRTRFALDHALALVVARRDEFVLAHPQHFAQGRHQSDVGVGYPRSHLLTADSEMKSFSARSRCDSPSPFRFSRMYSPKARLLSIFTAFYLLSLLERKRQWMANTAMHRAQVTARTTTLPSIPIVPPEISSGPLSEVAKTFG